MKWKKSFPLVGDVRVRSKFLWWPVTIQDKKTSTTYWLEKVKVTEVYDRYHPMISYLSWIIVDIESI